MMATEVSLSRDGWRRSDRFSLGYAFILNLFAVGGRGQQTRQNKKPLLGLVDAKVMA
jgi:hypothetical protein